MNDSIITLHGKDLTLENISGSYLIDKLVYNSEYIGQPETYFNWFSKNPDIYTMLFDKISNKIIGYFNLMPVNDVFYQKYLNFEIYDNNGLTDAAINNSDLEIYQKGKYYNMLLVSFAIHPEYQSFENVKLLINAFWEKILLLSQKDFYVKNIIGDVVSGSGKKLSKFLFFKYLKPTNYNTNIYILELFEFLSRYNGNNIIINNLIKKYII